MAQDPRKGGGTYPPNRGTDPGRGKPQDRGPGRDNKRNG